MAGCLGLLLALLLSLLPALAAECNLTDSGEQAVGALEESTGALQGSAEPLEGNADLGEAAPGSVDTVAPSHSGSLPQDLRALVSPRPRRLPPRLPLQLG